MLNANLFFFFFQTLVTQRLWWLVTLLKSQYISVWLGVKNLQAINDKILSLKYSDFSAEIKSVDSQESFNGGVSVLVTGHLTGKDNMIRNFSQSFFLAPQDRGYFVLNDMLRYVEIANQDDRSHVPVADTVTSVIVEQGN